MQDFCKDSNRQFTGKPADEILAFALGYFGSAIAFQTRFSPEDQVLTDLIVQMIPETLIYIDESLVLTPEMQDLLHKTEQQYGITIPVIHRDSIATFGLEAILSSERNPNSGSRQLEHFEWDETHGVIIVRPLLHWNTGTQ